MTVARRRTRNAARISSNSRGRLGLESLESRELLTLLGQQLFLTDSAWNQKISSAPVAANSAAIIGNIISDHGSDGRLHPDFAENSGISDRVYGIPYNVVHGNTQAGIRVVVDAYQGESDVRVAPIPANAVLEGDMQNSQTIGVNNRGDSHLIVYDVDNNIAYEFYRVSRPSENSDGQWHADQESVWNLNTDRFRPLGWTSADAAGLPILPGLVRPDEGLPVSEGGQGVIDHAIRFTLQNSIILNQFIYPAEHTANPRNDNAAVQPPMGTRFRLKANVDISGLAPESKVIAQAMKDYGLILSDNGSDFFFSGASGSVDTSNQNVLTWSDSDIQDLRHGLTSLHYSDFEVVDLSPQVTALSATTGTAGSSVTVVGQNFSGAGGQLQVFFGATPATNVTILDDSHLSAIVPAGTGTVNVVVQSGATVASNSHNVKNTVFGYGTSAVSANATFTYQSATSLPPVAVNDVATAVAGRAVTINVLAGDMGAGVLTVASVSSPSQGTAAINPDNTVTYTSRSGASGTDQFTYTIADGLGRSAVATVTVHLATPDRLVFSTPTVGTVGTALSLTVALQSSGGAIDTGYTGTLHFSSSDAQASLPADYTFTAADAGSHTFNLTLWSAGTVSVGAADATTPSITGASTIQVNPPVASPLPARTLTLSGFPTTTTAGTPQGFTLTALDATGNVATGYTGTVHFSSSNWQSTLPTDYTFTTADAGSHTFTATLKVAGANRAIVVGDTRTGIQGVATGIAVTPAAMSGFSLSRPVAILTAGVSVPYTVTAVDAYGNTIPDYTGTVHFDSDDPQARLPADSTFTSADAGSRTLNLTLRSAGIWYLEATDTTFPDRYGVDWVETDPAPTSAPAAILAPTSAQVARSLVISGLPATTTAGGTQNFTVTALDVSGNPVPGYTGTLHFSSSDAQVNLPADYIFTAADAGSHTFNLTLWSAGTVSIQAADATTPSITGASTVQVSPSNRKLTSGPSYGDQQIS